MKIDEFYLSEETAESCLIMIDGIYYHLTAEQIVKYGKLCNFG